MLRLPKFKSWGSQMDLVDEFETGSAISLAQSAESKECVLDPEQSRAFEELFEVMTLSVDKLNLAGGERRC